MLVFVLAVDRIKVQQCYLRPHIVNNPFVILIISRLTFEGGPSSLITPLIKWFLLNVITSLQGTTQAHGASLGSQ